MKNLKVCFITYFLKHYNFFSRIKLVIIGVSVSIFATFGSCCTIYLCVRRRRRQRRPDDHPVENVGPVEGGATGGQDGDQPPPTGDKHR